MDTGKNPLCTVIGLDLNSANACDTALGVISHENDA